MIDIERFEPEEDCGCGGGRMRPRTDGDWVRYEDYYAATKSADAGGGVPDHGGADAGVAPAGESVTKDELIDFLRSIERFVDPKQVELLLSTFTITRKSQSEEAGS